MIEQGEPFTHVDTPGGYIEVDTQQDFEYARQHWVTIVSAIVTFTGQTRLTTDLNTKAQSNTNGTEYEFEYP